MVESKTVYKIAMVTSRDTCWNEFKISSGPSMKYENTSINGNAIILPQTTRARGESAATFLLNILPAAQENAEHNASTRPINDVPAPTWLATMPTPMNEISAPMIFQLLGRSLKNMAERNMEKNTCT